MYNDYTQIERSYGIVLVNSLEVGKTYYEFTFNCLRTNEMKITLINPPVSIKEFLDKEVKSISIISKQQYEKKVFNLSLSHFSFEITGKSAVLTCLIEEFIVEKLSNASEEGSYINLVFEFPLTSLTNTFHGEIKHSEYGLIRGEYNHETDEITLKKDEYSIETRIGLVKITGSYSSINLPSSELYSFVKTVRSSVCKISIPYMYEETHIKIKEVEDYVDMIFTLISFIERDRIYWTSEFIRLYDSASNHNHTIQTYRWQSPASENYRKELGDNPKRRETLRIMIAAIEKLGDKERQIIIELMKNIEIANCATTIETKLIHFHSCLDFFRGKFNKKSNKFSKGLVDLLDEYGVVIADLIGERELNDIRKQTNKYSTFKFTQLRNGYLHDGFSIFEGDYENVIKEVDKMRCICERFILKYLKIDYTNTVLGK